MRQPVLFVIAGGLQYGFDTLVYGLLIASGLPGTSANVLSRGAAALLGFGFNRYITFAKAGAFAKAGSFSKADTSVQAGESWSRFSGSVLRFAALWVAMTIASSLLLLAAHEWLGGGVTEKVIHKMLVEAFLAVVSFFVSRNWVFRE